MNRRWWECECACGEVFKVPADRLCKGKIKSCPCDRKPPLPCPDLSPDIPVSTQRFNAAIPDELWAWVEAECERRRERLGRKSRYSRAELIREAFRTLREASEPTRAGVEQSPPEPRGRDLLAEILSHLQSFENWASTSAIALTLNIDKEIVAALCHHSQKIDYKQESLSDRPIDTWRYHSS